MPHQHLYLVTINWTGNKGQGTSNYRSYDRSHVISAKGKADISGSSDAAFRGDASMYSPEDLFVASLSACHMLWYLHLCAEAGVVVVDYFDNALGTMVESADGSGHFSKVTLAPEVTVSEASMIGRANELHKRANELCFIANSCNFPVYHNPACKAVNSLD
ncbi:OsmC family protein [Segetibacter koreensis]|uniref:OsmC family protein n=1 Tax=Segetibacter koreensis TaxID=398037 RepID=UPI00036A7A32|nr:OsmC family protein [Segetibacter koreensis]